MLNGRWRPGQTATGPTSPVGDIQTWWHPHCALIYANHHRTGYHSLGLRRPLERQGLLGGITFVSFRSSYCGNF